MAIAGISWGFYSLRGRGSLNPLAETTDNFVRALPLVAAASVLALSRFHIDPRGVTLSVASGAVASGLGYVAWFAALRGLTRMQAATVQISVPVIAAFGGVLFLSESISLRLFVSSALVLGGIALAIVSRERLARSAEASMA
jgi:drug/metabolite transporter (DMT)-like permease